MKLINSMSQIDSLRMQMYFRSSLLSTQNLKEATTWNTSTCLQARSKELKCYCCCILSPYMTVAVDMCHFTCTVASFQFCHFAGEESWYFMTPPWLPPEIMSEEVFTRENLHWRESQTGMTFWFRVTFTWWLGHFISRYLKVHFMLIK